MLAKIYGSAIHGVDAFNITIEVDVGQGTKFFISRSARFSSKRK